MRLIQQGPWICVAQRSVGTSWCAAWMFWLCMMEDEVNKIIAPCHIKLCPATSFSVAQSLVIHVIIMRADRRLFLWPRHKTILWKKIIFLECLNSLDVGCWSNCKSQIAKWLLCQIFVVKSFNSLATELSSERPRVVISDYQATSRENFIPANIPLTSPWWLNFDGNLFTLQGRCTLCSPVLRDCDKLKSIWSAKVSSLARILMTFLHATPLFCLIKMFCYDCNLY